MADGTSGWMDDAALLLRSPYLLRALMADGRWRTADALDSAVVTDSRAATPTCLPKALFRLHSPPSLHTHTAVLPLCFVHSRRPSAGDVQVSGTCRARRGSNSGALDRHAAYPNQFRDGPDSLESRQRIPPFPIRVLTPHSFAFGSHDKSSL